MELPHLKVKAIKHLRDFFNLAACRLALQDVNLKMEPEEKKLILSVYKRTKNAKPQIEIVMIDNGAFPLRVLCMPISKERQAHSGGEKCLLKMKKNGEVCKGKAKQMDKN